jgi:hypothetical protein
MQSVVGRGRVVVAAAVVVLCAGAGIAAAAVRDAPELVPNQGIGDARMGESQIQLALSYGSFCFHGCPGKVTIGELGMTTIAYRVPGGILRIALRSNRIAVLETTSPRYRMAGGFGVGSKLPARTYWNGFRPRQCPDGSGAWVRAGHAVTTSLYVLHGVVRDVQLRLRKLPPKPVC